MQGYFSLVVVQGKGQRSKRAKGKGHRAGSKVTGAKKGNDLVPKGAQPLHNNTKPTPSHDESYIHITRTGARTKVQCRCFQKGKPASVKLLL